MTQPPSITLFGFGEGFGLPEVSPYVSKTEVQLKMAGLAYRKDRSGFARAPKGKLPYIDDGELVADSTFIRAHLEKKHGLDLDGGLDEAQRALSWTLERMLEDHLAWALVYFRWVVRDNFDKGPARFFDGAPEAMREKLRADAYETVKRNMHGHGLGRHSEHEIVELAGKSLAALATLVGNKPYLFGDRPRATDATAFAVLAGILTPHFSTPLRARAAQHKNLVAYTARMMQRFYPEHTWAVAT
jgi:glutathione S-transferase